MADRIAQVVLIKDIRPGRYNESSYLDQFVEFEHKLYFRANDGVTGSELWVSDGTTEGTQLLKDIYPGLSEYNAPFGSDLFDLKQFADKLYFTADDGEHGRELWVSDGTTEGTQLLKDVNPGSSSDHGFGRYDAAKFFEFADKLYFTANDGVTGSELWVSDGTTEGTQLLKDISPSGSKDHPRSSNPSNFIEFQGKLYFRADDGEHGNEFWVTDGTTEGTQLLKDINPTIRGIRPLSSAPLNFIEFDYQLYFSANGVDGRELWVSDGTTEGTQLLKDINPGINDRGYVEGSDLSRLTEFKGQLYFGANDGEHGSELWVSDGSAEGTQLLKALNPGISDDGRLDSSYPDNFVEFQEQLYFTADDGEHGRELWVTDGTLEGTQLVKDINPGIDQNGRFAESNISNFTEFNQRLYFTADDGEHGNELWVTDGTTEGTQLLVDTFPGGSYFYSGNDYLTYYDIDLIVVNNELLLTANNGETGRELYKLTFNLTGTDDRDRLIGNNNPEEILGLKGNDTLGGKAGKDLLDGGADDDALYGADGQDTLTGGSGNDLLRGQSGKDILDGGAGDDTLYGGNQFDRLSGGDGDDILTGGRGINIYHGGAGRDLFVINDDAQTDWIADFELGRDRLGLMGMLSFAQLEITGNSNSLFFYQGEQVAVVLGISPDSWNESNFQQV